MEIVPLNTEDVEPKTDRNVEKLLLIQLKPAEQAYFNSDSACLKETRKPVLSQIMDWINSESEKRVFWMHGLAGSGKSTIAHTIAKELDAKGLLSGCFFCKRGIPSLHSPDALIPTLTYHLTRWHEPFRKIMLAILQGTDREKLDANNLQWQFDLLLKQPLEQLQADNPSHVPSKPLLFVVDALDECGDEPASREKLAKLFAQLASSVSWLKIFISSRPNPEIESGFKQAGYGFKSLDLNTISAQQDIELYSRSWIGKSPHLDPIWRTDERITVLVDKACGLFIWASSVQEFVMDPKVQDKNRALDKICFTDTFSGPQANLDTLYRGVLELAANNVNDLEIVRAILCTITIVAKHRPLPISGLTAFLPPVLDEQAISDDIVKRTVTGLRSVLFEDPSLGGALRALHSTFLDFMKQKSRCGRFWTDPVKLNQHIAMKSLKIMKTGLKFNICGLETSYQANIAVGNLQDIIKSNISDALQYGCIHWADHLIQSGNTVSIEPTIADSVIELICTSRALYWLEVLSFLRSLQSSFSALRIVTRLYKVRISFRIAKN